MNMSSSTSLTPAQLNHLLQLLSLEFVDQQSLESLSTRLSNHFSRAEAFKVGLALTHLLQHPDLLPQPQQRLCALVFLHDLFKAEPVTLNPFLSVFVHFLYYDYDEERKVKEKQKQESNNKSNSNSKKNSKDKDKDKDKENKVKDKGEEEQDVDEDDEKDMTTPGQPLMGVSLTQIEKQFITLLVTGAAKEWIKKTPK